MRLRADWMSIVAAIHSVEPNDVKWADEIVEATRPIFPAAREIGFYSIDYASDLRAPTPTAAAERAVPVRAELVERVTSADGRLKNGLVRGLERRRTELRAAAAKLPRLETIFQIPQQRYDRAAERLNAALVTNSRAAQSKFDRVAARLRPEALAQDISRRRDHLNARWCRRR